MRGQVDLRTAKPGDILISALGGILRYVERLPEGDYLDHKVEYLFFNGQPLCSPGTRTHDGYVFRNNRIPETDHDIIAIIPLEDWNKLHQSVQ